MIFNHRSLFVFNSLFVNLPFRNSFYVGRGQVLGETPSQLSLLISKELDEGICSLGTQHFLNCLLSLKSYFRGPVFKMI